MKKITLSVVVLFATLASFAQFNQTGTKGREVKNTIKRSYSAQDKKEEATFYIDYDAYESNLFQDQYKSFIWDMNKNYSLPGGDTSLAFCAVSFNKIFNTNLEIEYPLAQIQSLTVDSLFAAISHINTSGTEDTLIFKIVSVTGANGFPSASSILHADTIYTSTSLSTQIGNMVVVAVKPDYQVTAKKFGVILEYHGAVQDSCYFLAGFTDKGACASMDISAMKSQFFPNSYAYWMEYAQILPTSSGADIYYDCNSDGQYTDGTDGANFIQNIGLWAKVTAPNTVGINNSKATNVSVYPNPAKNSLNISNLAENTTVTVVNALGQVVYNTIASGNLMINTSDFNEGVYFVRVNQNVTKVSIQK